MPEHHSAEARQRNSRAVCAYPIFVDRSAAPEPGPELGVSILPPDMRTRRTELTYLLEVEDLCEAILEHGQRLEAAAAEWLRAANHHTVREHIHPRNRPPDDWPEALHVSLRMQGEMWLAISGLLGAWAHLSLMFFPSPIGPKARVARSAERAAWLRTKLGVPDQDDHILADRDLRNRWEHYDEYLDEALELYGIVTPQRFNERGYLHSGVTMRFIEVEPLALTFMAGTRTAARRELRQMIAFADWLLVDVYRALGRPHSKQERQG